MSDVIIRAARHDEDDLLPLSGLQHVVFCERQCALIHLEQAWRDNGLTAEGRVLHDHVDIQHTEGRGDVRIARSVPLRSFHLGVVGRADVVELHRVEGAASGACVAGLDGRWRPFPVEYKRGRSKWSDCDRVQLCAQAICLEEMLGVPVTEGALFYGQVRRRETVVFDERLRAVTTDAAGRFRDFMTSGQTPPAVWAPKCRRCSLIDVCLPPRRRATHRSVARYLDESVTTVVE